MASKDHADNRVEQEIRKYGPTRASLRASPNQIYMIFSKSKPYRSLETNCRFHDLYLEVRAEEVVAVTAERPGTIRSVHTFSEDYFEEIRLESNQPVGIVVPAYRQQKMTDMMENEAQILMKSREDSHLAERLIVTDGDLYSWIVAPDEHEEVAQDFIPDSS